MQVERHDPRSRRAPPRHPAFRSLERESAPLVGRMSTRCRVRIPARPTRSSRDARDPDDWLLAGMRAGTSLPNRSDRKGSGRVGSADADPAGRTTTCSRAGACRGRRVRSRRRRRTRRSGRPRSDRRRRGCRGRARRTACAPRPEAREEERAARRRLGPGIRARERALQVLRGGLAVAHVEAHAPAAAQRLADPQPARLRVDAEQVADQPGSSSRRWRRDPSRSRGTAPARPGSGRAARPRRAARLQGLEDRLLVEPLEEVPLAPGDAHGPSERAAALRDGRRESMSPISATPTAPSAQDAVAVEEHLLALAPGAARESADLHGVGIGEVETGEQALGGHREGVGDEHEGRVVGGGDRRRPRATRAGGASGSGRSAASRWKPCVAAPGMRPARSETAGHVLELASAADHAAGAAADHVRVAQGRRGPPPGPPRHVRRARRRGTGRRGRRGRRGARARRGRARCRGSRRDRFRRRRRRPSPWGTPCTAPAGIAGEPVAAAGPGGTTAAHPEIPMARLLPRLAPGSSPCCPSSRPRRSPEEDAAGRKPPKTVKVVRRPFTETIEVSGTFVPAAGDRGRLRARGLRGRPEGRHGGRRRPRRRRPGAGALRRRADHARHPRRRARPVHRARAPREAGGGARVPQASAGAAARAARDGARALGGGARHASWRSTSPPASRSPSTTSRARTTASRTRSRSSQQLERMYEADDLTEETEEIVIRRARRGLARTRTAFEWQKQRHERFLEITLPREEQDLKVDVEKKQLDLGSFGATSEPDLRRAEVELEKARTAFERQEKRMRDLRADRDALRLRAPADGYAVPGAFQGTAWKDLDGMRRDAGAGRAPEGAAGALHDRAPGQRRRADDGGGGRPAAVKTGLKAVVRPGRQAGPGARRDGRRGAARRERRQVRRCARPGADGSDADAGTVLQGRDRHAAGRERARGARRRPSAKDGDRHLVHRFADGQVEAREVQVGATSGEHTEILGGLEEGDRILAQAPKPRTTSSDATRRPLRGRAPRAPAALRAGRRGRGGALLGRAARRPVRRAGLARPRSGRRSRAASTTS